MAGPPFKRIGYVEVCEAIKNSDHYSSKLTGKNRGRGVAIGFWINGGMQSSAIVNIHADGTASLITGSVDIGGTRASTRDGARPRCWDCAPTDVRPSVADTDSNRLHRCDRRQPHRASPPDWRPMKAAQDVVRQLKERAARLWEIAARRRGLDRRQGDLEEQRRAADDVARNLASKLRPHRRTRSPDAPTSMPTGVGPTFAGCLVDVEVDPETAKVQVLRCTMAQDAGKAIHPSYVEGQMQGGASQGIGWALNEEYVYDDKGVMRNASFLDYRMPTCLDLPMIEAIIVEVPNPGASARRARSGEVPIVPPPAAVANAISHAIGIRVTELPMSPPNLYKAMHHKK